MHYKVQNTQILSDEHTDTRPNNIMYQRKMLLKQQPNNFSLQHKETWEARQASLPTELVEKVWDFILLVM